jgi:hypothetical protein
MTLNTGTRLGPYEIAGGVAQQGNGAELRYVLVQNWMSEFASR